MQPQGPHHGIHHFPGYLDNTSSRADTYASPGDHTEHQSYSYDTAGLPYLTQDQSNPLLPPISHGGPMSNEPHDQWSNQRATSPSTNYTSTGFEPRIQRVITPVPSPGFYNYRSGENAQHMENHRMQFTVPSSTDLHSQPQTPPRQTDPDHNRLSVSPAHVNDNRNSYGILSYYGSSPAGSNYSEATAQGDPRASLSAISTAAANDGSWSRINDDRDSYAISPQPLSPISTHSIASKRRQEFNNYISATSGYSSQRSDLPSPLSPPMPPPMPPPSPSPLPPPSFHPQIGPSDVNHAYVPGSPTLTSYKQHSNAGSVGGRSLRSLRNPTLPSPPATFSNFSPSDAFYTPNSPPHVLQDNIGDVDLQPKDYNTEIASLNSSISQLSTASSSTRPSNWPSTPSTLSNSSHRIDNLSSTNGFATGKTLERFDSQHSNTPIVDTSNAKSHVNAALLSHIALYVKDQTPRGSHMKGPLEHPRSFTADELISTITALNPAIIDRRTALQIARSLQQSLWFHEVDWSENALKDAPGYVYIFSADEELMRGDNLESLGLDEIPTGISTNLTACYSPMCGKHEDASLCYSYTCPNKSRRVLHRQESISSTVDSLKEDADNWETSVPISIVKSLSKTEIARQSLIFEMIQGEHKYLADLELIESGFVVPLRTSNPSIIPPDRIEPFLNVVLLKVAEIREHSRKLANAFTKRQEERKYLVNGIADLLLMAALDWGADYTAFTVNFPMADAIFKEEKAFKPAFSEFLMDFHKLPAAEKRGFDSFHSRPTFRILRYTLLLESMLKNTPEGHPDREYIEQAISVIKQQGADANDAINVTRNKVSLREYQRDLATRTGEFVNLDLADPEREFFVSGKAYRRTEGAGFTEWPEIHLILFDHYLVTTKPPRLDRNGHTKYVISRKALPLELIHLKPNSISEPPVPRVTGFHLRSRTERSQGEGPLNLPSTAQDALMYPITFQQLGRYSGMVTFFFDSPAVRAHWEKKLRAALAQRAMHSQTHRAMQLNVLSDQTFGAPSFGSLAPEAPVSSHYGRPTCSAPLSTSDGQELVVTGCAEGLFIGFRGRSRSFKRVVHLTGITQCAVLQNAGFILVVANKVLIAYSLEALVPTGASGSQVPQRLSGQKDVLFFRVGKIGGEENPRTLIIYVKRSGVKESVFKALEPVASGAGQRTGGRFLGFGGNKNDWFRTYKDFFLPGMAFSVHFLRSKLAIICSKGVEVMNLETLRTMSVPDFSAHRQNPVYMALARRCDEAKTLGMFRLQENLLLLVYDDFAFHVDRHGEPVNHTLIDWESKPEEVAYQTPYICAFSSTMIEIRNAFTGKLEQIITGSQISLTYDGSNIDGARSAEDFTSRIHFSKREGCFHVLYEMMPVPPRS